MSAKQKNMLLQPSPEKWVPAPYQRRAVEWLLGHAGAGIFLDPGLGKTSTTLEALRILFKSGVAQRALIVAPKRVCALVWPAEVAKWAQFAGMTVTLLHGSAKDDALDAEAQIFLINPEGLKWLLTSAAGMAFLKTVDTLVVDESTKFKNSASQRFKMLKRVLHLFRRRWILTGTPSPNGLLDLFGQQYIVDMGRALGAYITHYRAKWFAPTGYGGYDWKVRDAQAETEIHTAMKPTTLRLDEADFVKLPPVRTNYIYVDLPTKAQKLYDKMEDEMLVEIKGNVIAAVSNGVAQGKCRQIAGGALYLYQDRTGIPMNEQYEAIHDEKLTALEDLVEQRQGSPMLVLWQYKHEAHRIRKRFGKHSAFIGENDRRDRELCDLWNTGGLPVLYAHPTSIAHGLNLQYGGNALCWYSFTWNSEERDQTVRRLRRRGSSHASIVEHFLIARGTIDELMVKVVDKKILDQKTFLDALRTYRSKK